eukprot:CAMPEP_0205831566 /NCGR_PEP_ID=MMETSP0206-20130828/44418_1 /ASSEMBLY_ACC=CAM_ASM_000279 /TAXON_ID=36767 /ORGANISM="Euplotes focardii, Strain TN1" /LENGTH=203 /DNA_ID=CAMNT_0053136311 /DNA_START=24 /DNA_END=632 /DNA_ORIENTATION=-
MSQPKSTRNVGGVEDPHYRYTRPCLVVCVRQPGTNNQRTVVTNLPDISKALKVPVEYISRFLGKELATLTKYQSAKREASFKGIHSAEALEAQLEKFEKLFIVCPKCGDGGTRLSVKPKRAVQIKCGACGAKTPPGTGHPIEKYMSKHPPPKKGQLALKGGAGGKVKGKRGKKKARGAKVDDGDFGVPNFMARGLAALERHNE